MKTDIAVIGAGIIGSLVAYEARKAGENVVLCDPDMAGAASMASAGILAPEAEAANARERKLSQASFERYPDLLIEVQAKTATPIAHAFPGTYTLPGDFKPQSAPNAGHQTPPAALPPGLLAAAQLHTGGYVHPKQLTLALRSAFLRDGGVFVNKAVTDLETDADSVHLSAAEESIHAKYVVIAAGAWSGRFGVPVQPQRGEALVLEGFSPPCPINVGAGYILPFDGHTYVGATKRSGWQTGIDVEGLAWLVRYLETWFPTFAALRYRKLLWGFRPQADAPLIGRLSKRVIAASGHGKRGVLWAPGTAADVLKLIGVHGA